MAEGSSFSQVKYILLWFQARLLLQNQQSFVQVVQECDINYAVTFSPSLLHVFIKKSDYF